MLTYTYKLYNKKNYQKEFDRQVSCCRLVYNLAKETKEHAYRQFGVVLGKYDLMKQLPELKQEYEWLKKANAQSLQEAIERLDKAFQKFFNGSGYPKWAKRNKFSSIVLKQGNLKRKNPLIYQTETGFKIPTFGEVKVFNNKRKINGKIKRVVLKQKADGLYLLVVFEPNENKKHFDRQETVAIDMGLRYFYASSDGEFVDNPKHLDKYLKALRVENRSLSRKKKGSKNWYKQVKRLKSIYKKISDTRGDFLHKQSSLLANSYKNVFVEDINISNLIKNSCISRQILDASWGNFFKLLEYKTNVIKVNPAYTSQTCSKCNHIDKKNRPTQSIFKCVKCGFEMNADQQACLNILKLGHQLLYANVNH